jgi:hypothetical protein
MGPHHGESIGFVTDRVSGEDGVHTTTIDVTAGGSIASLQGAETPFFLLLRRLLMATRTHHHHTPTYVQIYDRKK